MRDNTFNCMRDQQTSLSNIMSLERMCSDGAMRLRTALESQLHAGITSGDLWDKTVSFFAIKKVPLFPSGYTKHSREAVRLFPSSVAEDALPLCCQ